MKKQFRRVLYSLTGTEAWKLKQLFWNMVRYHKLSFNINSKRYWNEKLRRIQGFWRNENYKNILGLLPRDKEFSLLDVGCALGDGCDLLKKTFPKARISGVDISEMGIKKAKRKYKGVDFSILNILRDTIPGVFDYITIIETLEHFDDPFMVVDKCLKSANQSVIISVPYSKQYIGPINIGMFDEHRYAFNEMKFSEYNCSVCKITDYMKVNREKCII